MISAGDLGKFLGSSTDFALMDATLNSGLKRALFFGRKVPLLGFPVYLAGFFPTREGFSLLQCAAVMGVMSLGVRRVVLGGGLLWCGVLGGGVF